MDILLDFQTQIPENNGVLKRKRLYSKLDEIYDESKSIIFISAPAGFGKTTLVSDWISNKSNRAAWFSVDENLNTPLMFINGVIKSLSKTSKIRFSNTVNIMKMPLKINIKSIVFTLIKEIELIEEKVVLVIDNFHLVESELIYDFLELLLKFMPKKLNLVILSRKDLSFSKIQKLNTEILSLNQDDLKFNYLELRKLINREESFVLSRDELEKIYQTTEGWPYAVEFIIYKLISEGEDVIKNLDNESDLNPFYLNNHLLSDIFLSLNDEEKDFLLKTAVVENFTADLANFLRKAEDSYLIINKLLKNNIFIEVIDRENSYFRYYNLFREFLIKQLKPGEKRKHFLTAAEWFAENNYYREAVLTALKIDNKQLAVKYLEKSIPMYIKNADLKELLNLFDLIEENHLKESPLLLIIKALSLFIMGKQKESLYYINLIKNRGELTRENKGRLLTLSTFLQSYQDAETHCNTASEALNLIADDDYLFKINGLMTLGQIQASYSKVNESAESFKRAAFLAREKGHLFMEINSLMNLILILAQAGRLEEALNLNLESIERLSRNHKSSGLIIDLLLITLGIIYYNKGEYQLAKDNLIKGIESAELLNLVHVYWMPMIYYGLSSYYLGETKAAEEIINDTLELCSKYNKEYNYIMADIEKLNFKLNKQNNDIDILLQQKIESYASIVEQDTFMIIKTKVTFLLSNLYFNLEKHDQALIYLNKLETNKLDYPDKIRLKILKSIIFYGLDNKEKSRDFLVEALLMVEKENYITVFIEKYNDLKKILIEFDYLGSEVLKDINFEEDVKAQEMLEKKLLDPLTEREIEIIELLAEGLSNKKIAEILFITEGTTKWHLSNIYSKLAVRNRTKAAAKARKLNII